MAGKSDIGPECVAAIIKDKRAKFKERQHAKALLHRTVVSMAFAGATTEEIMKATGRSQSRVYELYALLGVPTDSGNPSRSNKGLPTGNTHASRPPSRRVASFFVAKALFDKVHAFSVENGSDIPRLLTFLMEALVADRGQLLRRDFVKRA